MPIDYRNYPADWRERSREIRFGRARGLCERCGAENYKPHPETGSRVVLTVAHQCECVPLCAEPSHLLALCQCCHLRQDAKLHAANARRTRAKKCGQMWLADIE